MDEQSIAWGRMRAGPGDRKVCIDHLQKDLVSYRINVVPLTMFVFFQCINLNLRTGNDKNLCNDINDNVCES